MIAGQEKLNDRVSQEISKTVSDDLLGSKTLQLIVGFLLTIFPNILISACFTDLI